MNTDTPRTDDSETRVRKNGISSLIEYCYANDMAKLERELTAVTEQRDAVTLRLGRTQEKMFDAERQRDRLAEALEMVRDADDDCHKDGLQTIPSIARFKIDAAIAFLEGGDA